jgi:hypothetical protein
LLKPIIEHEKEKRINKIVPINTRRIIKKGNKTNNLKRDYNKSLVIKKSKGK